MSAAQIPAEARQQAYEHNVRQLGEYLHTIGVTLHAACPTEGCRLSWQHPGECVIEVAPDA